MTSDAHLSPPADAEAIQNWMVTYITSVIDVAADPFPVAERFDNYGLDSIEITIMCGMMEETYAIEVGPTEVFDHPSVTELSQHIAGRLKDRSAAA
ncbi:acyl carrier protein [Pararhodobacter zhoushanensis]|uniref:acyl carrier protein n=1 Tax=Pararhodobacter zhoushanensis TaxID=2479545 RepID=UPI000F8EA685|nr:acyl carrier protein [Pararhodobacter zhoushanensis]